MEMKKKNTLYIREKPLFALEVQRHTSERAILPGYHPSVQVKKLPEAVQACSISLCDEHPPGPEWYSPGGAYTSFS